jgi:DNA-binding LacI/PurR family transcriptional regulator
MRRDGFLGAYREKGLSVDAGLLRTGLDDAAQIDEAVRELAGLAVDAMICMDDAVANHVLKTLRELHVAVPQDMKLASFYNGVLLENHVPAVTALSFHARELGMAACRTLLDLIEGAKVQARTLLPYEIVWRESTVV